MTEHGRIHIQRGLASRPIPLLRSDLMMRIRNQRHLLLALCVSGVLMARAADIVTQPFAGITLIARSEVSPRNVRLHVVLVDLTTPGLSFKLTPPSGSRDTVRQTTLDFLTQEKAQIALNVHFFVPFPSDEVEANVVGFAASQGTVYSPFEAQPVGSAYSDQSYAIMAYAPALNIDEANRVTLVRRDPDYADNRHCLPRIVPWNVLSGSAQIVTDGVKTIPHYSHLPDGLKASKTYSANHSWYDLPRARTAVGITADRKTLIVLAVEQASGSAGMTVGEAADLLIKDYHTAQALNLDGGGSTTLVLQDPLTRTGRIVTTASGPSRGRAVGSNLAIFVPALRSAGMPPTP
ncbi:MAG: hypothetical protein RLZZ162_761 [Verrucomicrobiota bacterium]